MFNNPPNASVLAPSLVPGVDDIIMHSLSFMRSHLEMDVAYVSEFVGDDVIFRDVCAPGYENSIKVGGRQPLAETYCNYVVSGQLPELIPDTKLHPFTAGLEVTHTFPVGSYVGVPILRDDGSVYGMFCSFGKVARPTLNNRDLEVARAFASLAGDQVNARLKFASTALQKLNTIRDVLEAELFEIALQPILRLKDQGTAGYEALCRFSPQPYRPPDQWFDDAAEVGLQVALELFVIEVALKVLPQLPASCYLAVNTSPATLATGKLSALIEAAGGSRVVVEITEHAAIEDIDVLLMEIDKLREHGARIAVDDAGAGYSGLQQIIRLRPDVIKLDMSLTHDVDKDLARRALASAMVQFARDTNAHVVAEGIETEAEMRTLKNLGVEMGQGFHLGRPTLSSDVLKLVRSA
ncbi:sensor domain-containing phosphodiesterase [Octadecabacter ascidiaceicola]|uniref:Putative cyclic-di-GMP phosphodiesterase AdrB n=1 Tax=Octadecabacter ascidiaceicola TaxID=1655543 RepID=A0A238KQY1_9RHOB|nr:EAL domain-containing protein [Octadecabacter ascidiaceicola]SMX44446.1 Putative cyclic-di-GMP phosphodiesterase AdrB [Octadecabacter ascidiaceicola]